MGEPPSGKAAPKEAARLTRPAPLKAGHALAAFDCGDALMNGWLVKRALAANENDTARSFVTCRGARRVVGYYALAAGAVSHAGAAGALRRNAPDPVPAIVLARLGVDRSEQGCGLGQDLLSDAMKRALQAARIIGARALIVHALTARAESFYESRGFKRLNGPDEAAFFIAMKTIRDALA